MKKNKLAFFFFFLVMVSTVRSQHKQILDTTNTRNILEHHLQQALKKYDFTSALEISDSIANYGIITSDSLLLAYSYEIKSEIYKFQSNTQKTKENLKKALAIFKKYKRYNKQVVLHAFFASVYRNEGQLDSSFYMLDTARRYVTDSTSNQTLKFYYNQKSVNFERTSRLDSSIYYVLKRIEISSPTAHYELSVAYERLASFFYLVYDYEKALLYINKSLEHLKNIPEKYDLTQFKSMVAKSYILYELKDHEKAELLAKEALFLMKGKNFPDNEVQIKILLSKLNFETLHSKSKTAILSDTQLENKTISNNTLFDFYSTQLHQQLAIGNLEVCEQLIKTLDELLPKSNNLKSKQSYYQDAARYWNAVNAFENAFQAQKEYIAISNQIVDRQQTYNLYNLEAKYQLLAKEYEIAQQDSRIQQQINQLQNKKMQTNYALGALFLLMLAIIGLWLFYKQRQKRKDQELLVLKNEAQINSLEALIEGEEKERFRIAKELHDGVNGDLSAIKHKLNTLLELNNKTIKDAVVMIDKSCEQVRAISHNLVPPALENFDLESAISDYCTNMNNVHRAQITFDYLGDAMNLSKIVEINIFRITQELVTNSIKHAEAAAIDVQLSFRNSTIQLAVEDDGKGFDVLNVTSKGIGLSNVKNRVAFLNGEIDFVSSESGTSVNILIDTSKINHD